MNNIIKKNKVGLAIFIAGMLISWNSQTRT